MEQGHPGRRQSIGKGPSKKQPGLSGEEAQAGVMEAEMVRECPTRDRDG